MLKNVNTCMADGLPIRSSLNITPTEHYHSLFLQNSIESVLENRIRNLHRHILI